MSLLQVNVPDEVLASLRYSPEGLASELRILAAVKLYELGRLSSGGAAQLAGVPRVEFLTRLADYHVSPFQMDADELARDLDHA